MYSGVIGAFRVTHSLFRPASLRADCMACCRANVTFIAKQIDGSPVAVEDKYLISLFVYVAKRLTYLWIS